MNKFLKIFVLGVLSSVLLQSCESFLDTSPTTGVDESKAITNEENATAALVGVYAGIRHYYYYGRDYIMQGEVPTNNVKLKPTNSNRFIQEVSWTVTKSTSNVEYFWNKAYDVVNRTNNIINANISGDATVINSIKAEAYALRAMAHFDLVRIYAQCYDFTTDHQHLGVPYVKVFDPKGQPSRNTVAEVYTNILEDLKKADELVVGKFSRSMPPFTLTPGAINALYAKIYLYMGDYNNAKKYAELVIADKEYKLVTNSDYVKSWGDESTTESIFTIAQTLTTYPSTNALGYILLPTGYGDFLVNESLYNLYADGDIRKELIVEGTGSNVGNLYIKGKYPGRNGTTGLDNFNVLRLSEIYLIAAEASAKATPKDESSAQKYVTAIRQRAIPTAVSITTTGQTLIDDILLEKRKELAFEGNYYHDLKRLKMDVVAGVVNAQAPKEFKYPNDKFAWPIPESETNANPNIAKQQNPGY